MDDKLKNALEFANYANTLFNQKKLIHQNFLDACVYYYDAGKFSIDQQLISYCKNCLTSKNNILLDDNSIPIKISNPKQFIKNITDIYNSNIEDYYNEYQNLIKQKSVQGLIDE